MAITGLALDGDTIDAKEHRWLFPGAMFAHTGDPISVMPGITAGLKVTGLSGAQVQVDPGSCVVTPVDGERGSYVITSSVTETRNLAAPNATYSRIDLIVARARDASYSESPAGFTIEAVTGTASVAPVAPAAPTGTLVLAHATVPPSGVVSAQNNVGLLTSAIGGAMAGRSADRLALATAYLRPGQTYTETDTGTAGQTWRWNGTQWTPQFIQSTILFPGIVQRAFSFSYSFSVAAGRVYSPQIKLPTGDPWDGQSNLAGTITGGRNWTAPLPGSYSVKARSAVDGAQNCQFVLGIYKNLGATASDVSSIGSTPGTLLRETRQQFSGATGPQPIEVSLSLVRLAAGDTLSITVWHDAITTKGIIWENPHAAYLEITRLGD